jgi:hypothetical protein
VLKTGTEISQFRYSPSEAAETIYSVSVTPFCRRKPQRPTPRWCSSKTSRNPSGCVTWKLKPRTPPRQNHGRTPLARSGQCARAALDTQQLLDENYDDPEFRQSLSAA